MIYWLLVLHALIVSSTHIVSKDVTGVLPPALVLLCRAGTASVLFGVWLIYKRKTLPQIEKKDLKKILILGLLNIPANQFVFFLAIKLTTPPNASLAYSLIPVFVLLIGIIGYKQKSNILKTIGIAVALAGAAILFTEKGINLSSDTFEGNMLVLFASFSVSLYSVMGRDLTRKYGAGNFTAISTIAGFIIYLIIYFAFYSDTLFTPISGIQMAELGYLGVVTGVIGYSIWFYSIKKIETSKVAVFTNLQPIFTTILAVILFSQEITYIFVVGAVLIIAGVTITQRK